MAESSELTQRQEKYAARAKAITIHQLEMAGEILSETLDVRGSNPELLIALAQVIATNQLTQITDSGMMRIK